MGTGTYNKEGEAMLKATLRSAVLLGLVLWSVPSFAEVQNVRVGGEVNVRAFHRDSLRLSEDVVNTVGGDSTAGPVNAAADFGPGEDDFLQQLTAVDIGADLTENVSTQLRLINQRVWGGFASDATDTAVTDSGSAVEVSLANITLKELFYAPLTVTLGRQRLWFGRGFIVGSRLLQGDADPGQNIAADEFTDLTAFDAIRGTLDLSGIAGGLPIVVDGVYAKVDENDVSIGGATDSSADDVNLVGVNIGSKFNQWNSEVEAYYWNKRDNENNDGTNLETNSQANTLGFRGSVSPLEGTSVWSELAYQWGRRITSAITYDAEGAAGDDYSAWAANLGLDYTAGGVAWMPTVGGEWIFWSGDEDAASGSGNTAIGGWDPVFRGRFTSLIREFQGAGFYMPAQSGAGGGGAQGTFNNVTNSATNQHQLALHAALKPLEDLSVDNRLTWFIADKGIRPTTTPGTKLEHYLGAEWDVVANYNYTEDVQIGAVYGIFWPGSVFRSPYDDVAQELVTSVSVKF